MPIMQSIRFVGTKNAHERETAQDRQSKTTDSIGGDIDGWPMRQRAP